MTLTIIKTIFTRRKPILIKYLSIIIEKINMIDVIIITKILKISILENFIVTTPVLL